MSAQPIDTASAERKPTCFVAMGFGKKTDFESGRVLDLNASFDNLIKPAVEAAGLECIRADKISHSGIIDVPMYEQLLEADIVVADLSTSNRNAIYELGIRHALRPYTTVIIAEEGLMKSPFFDLNHIVIRTYRHLGEDIGVGEMKRFTADLTKVLKDIQAKQPLESRRDSPVYTFLQNLTPPTWEAVTNNGASVSALQDGGALTPAAPPAMDSYYEVLQQADDASKKKGGWIVAKVLLQQLREARRKAVAQQAANNYGQATKTEDPTILQRLALATYKSEYPNLQESLVEARDILALLEPRTSNDTETLGLWGSVNKRLWAFSNDRNELNESVRAYERGFYLANDYYNGINYAFLLDIRAAHAATFAEAIADSIQARRVRTQVIDSCSERLKGNPPPKGDEASDEAVGKYRNSDYWVYATLAESYIGLGDELTGNHWLKEATDLAPQQWMLDTTQNQIGQLRVLLADSPLKRLATLSNPDQSTNSTAVPNQPQAPVAQSHQKPHKQKPHSTH